MALQLVVAHRLSALTLPGLNGVTRDERAFYPAFDPHTVHYAARCTESILLTLTAKEDDIRLSVDGVQRPDGEAFTVNGLDSESDIRTMLTGSGRSRLHPIDGIEPEPARDSDSHRARAAGPAARPVVRRPGAFPLGASAIALVLVTAAPPAEARTAAPQAEEQQAKEDAGHDHDEQPEDGHDHSGEENRNHDHVHHHEMTPYTEHVVVTAGGQQELVNAPVAITMLEAEIIEAQASERIGDLVRQAPGVNAAQVTSQVFTVTSRSVQGAPRGSQLLLLDGRPVSPLYSGVAAWHLVPVGLSDLERAEVINGPTLGAVWGADAMNGVTNLISRPPRESPGTAVEMRYGTFSRSVAGNDLGRGALMSFNARHAAVLNDQIAYRVSFGFSQDDGFARPAGEVRAGSGFGYPDIGLRRTRFPRVSFQVDWDAPDRVSAVTVSGGYSSHDGTLVNDFGLLESDADQRAFLQADYRRGSLEAGVSAHENRTEFRLPFALGPDFELLQGVMELGTYEFRLSDSRLLGERHLLRYGGNARAIPLDLNLAGLGDGRNEQGVFLQDEIFLGERLRFIVAGRADRISTLEDIVLSSAATTVFKPHPSHSLRVSWSRALRAPSLHNNFLDVVVGDETHFDPERLLSGMYPDLPIPEGFLAPVVLTVPTRRLGAADLRPERLTSWEIGYSGALGERVGGTAALYFQELSDPIFFDLQTWWTSTEAPPGWDDVFLDTTVLLGFLERTLPPGVLPAELAPAARDPAVLVDLFRQAGAGAPRTTGYSNRDYARSHGVELGLHGHLTANLGAWFNYAYRSEPDTSGIPAGALDRPAAHRFNLGLDSHLGIFRFGATASWQGRSYWADPLAGVFFGWTEPFTLVNATLDAELLEGQLIPSFRVVNLLDQDIRQHVRGAFIKRQLIAGIRYRF